MGKYTTTSITHESSKVLKIVVATTGETASEVIARLLRDELKRLRPELTRVLKESGLEYNVKPEK